MIDWKPRDIVDRAQELYFRKMRGPNARLPNGLAADIIWDGLLPDIRNKYYAQARRELGIDHA